MNEYRVWPEDAKDFFSAFTMCAQQQRSTPSYPISCSSKEHGVHLLNLRKSKLKCRPDPTTASINTGPPPVGLLHSLRQRPRVRLSYFLCRRDDEEEQMPAPPGSTVPRPGLVWVGGEYQLRKGWVRVRQRGRMGEVLQVPVPQRAIHPTRSSLA